MKTSNRILWGLLGAAVGGGIGYFFASEENKVKNTLIGAGIGGVGTLGGTLLADMMPTHVNYVLHHKNQRVYEGISAEYRIDTRMSEHKKDGKIFDTVLVSMPKPKSDAVDLEKYRIQRFGSKYNVQHNG